MAGILRQRPPTTETGRQGEQLVADYLCRNGYRILCRNYRTRLGEIDLVAEDGDVLCFVEVRTRQDAVCGHPIETIGARKQARILKAAEHYLAAHGCADRWIRFDVVGVVKQPAIDIQLIKGAFDATRP